jgi:hypothetical protein
MRPTRSMTTDSMMSHSDLEPRRCPRCSKLITSKSAFAISLWADDGRLLYDVVFTKNTPKNGVLMHMNADRECGSEISGYVGKLLRRLDLPADCDTSFLDRL